MIGRKLGVALICAVAGATAAARGQMVVETGTQPATKPSIPVVRLTLAPRAPVRPELEYALLPTAEQMAPGNAALKYYLALQMYTKPENNSGAFIEIENYWDKVEELRGASLATMNEGMAEKIVNQQRNALKLLRAGSRLESVEWGPDLRHDGIGTLLPYLGNLRGLGHILTLSIRLDIKHHRWAEAHDQLQTGYGLARHLNDGSTLIDALVGIAIAEEMNGCVQDWINEEGSPNLYWPLSNLPAPLCDMRRGLSFERSVCAFNFPQWKDMEEGRCTREQWADFCDRMLNISSMMERRTDPLENTFISVGLGMVQYPDAKRFLQARGMSEKEIADLPVPAVLGKYTARSYDEMADNVFKWLVLSYPQAEAGVRAADQEVASDRNGLNILARTLLPSLSRAKFNSARLDRRVAMLRVAEAIRAHAAEKGALPASLDALALPVPTDATTGKLFEYSTNGKTARLSSALVEPAANGAVYEITLGKP